MARLKDTDPEKFIIGRGSYTNLPLAASCFDGRVFRYDPAPVPVGRIIIHNLLFVAFFLGVYWLAEHYAHAGVERWVVYAPIGIGLLTSVIYTTVVFLTFSISRRRGPWLIYDVSTGQLDLPRQGMGFARDQIICLQYITTRMFDPDGAIHGKRLSELNVIVSRDGERGRWPVLRSRWPFDRLLEPLLKHTDLQVMRVEDDWRGGNVTERPYRQPDARPS